MNLTKETYFSSNIYFVEKQNWVNDYVKYTDPYIFEARKNTKDDIGVSYHSTPLTNDENFNELKIFICEQSNNILNEQGYDLRNSKFLVKDLWVQEFSKKGGGHHNSHVHSNTHINGFFFLKCSTNTSYPVFHDPRLYKRIIDLDQKNVNLVSDASYEINVKPKNGLLIFFNSYLEHQFVVDKGIDPFRFIHFNIQVIPNHC